jgi:hypothetical protein
MCVWYTKSGRENRMITHTWRTPPDVDYKFTEFYYLYIQSNSYFTGQELDVQHFHVGLSYFWECVYNVCSPWKNNGLHSREEKSGTKSNLIKKEKYTAKMYARLKIYIIWIPRAV